MTTITATLLPRYFALAQERAAQLAEKTRPDPDLTPEANARISESWRQQIDAQHAAKVAELIDEGAAMARAAKDTAAKHQAIDLDSPATLMRSEQAWTHIVRPALENGASLFEALAGADADAVAAAQRFAPSWLDRSGKDSSEVGLAVAARLAELAPTEQAAAEIRAGATADADLAALGTIAALHSQGDFIAAAHEARRTLGDGAKFVYDGAALVAITPPVAATGDDAA